MAELCRKQGLHADIYYKWLKEFMEAGKACLKGEEMRGATRGEVDRLQKENEQFRQAVAELTAEARALKKVCSETVEGAEALSADGR